MARTSPINSIKDSLDIVSAPSKCQALLNIRPVWPSTWFEDNVWFCCTATFRLFLGVATPTEQNSVWQWFVRRSHPQKHSHPLNKHCLGCSQSTKSNPTVYKVPCQATSYFESCVVRMQAVGTGEFKTGGKCMLPSDLPLYKIQPRAFFYNIETH